MTVIALSWPLKCSVSLLRVWPGASGCPSEGSVIACNDDTCGLQSSAVWGLVPGQSYTFQIGTFPGAGGGSGTFDVTQGAYPPCGTFDDGTYENAIGLTAGGEVGWIHSVMCRLLQLESVETAYGTPGGSAPPNGSGSRIVVYRDGDCDSDPSTGPGATRSPAISRLLSARGLHNPDRSLRVECRLGRA